jgi:hypothetical protein
MGRPVWEELACGASFRAAEGGGGGILFAAHCGPDPGHRTERPASPAVWAEPSNLFSFLFFCFSVSFLFFCFLILFFLFLIYFLFYFFFPVIIFGTFKF